MTAVDTAASEGTEFGPMVRTPDAVDLFLYSAAVWLPHRIHYDEPYTTQVEDHPALLVQGPLQGVYLAQLLAEQFGAAAQITSFTFRHESPVYAGMTLSCFGRVTSAGGDEISCDVWTQLEDGKRATVGQAVLRLNTPSQ